MAILELAPHTEHTDSPRDHRPWCYQQTRTNGQPACTDNGASNKKQTAALLVNSGINLNAC